MVSLCVGGLLVGLMIGRLLDPVAEMPRVLAIQPSANGLQLSLDRQPEVQAGHLEGALALRIGASAAAQQGQSRIGDVPLRWKLEPQGNGVFLTLVSTRPLRGDWDSAQVDGRWRLNIRVRSE